jgi:glycosyltransferase involved in cell wall biosynthesis
MNKTISLSFVIPVYQSSQTIKELYLQIVEVFGSYNSNWEILFIDDSSKDQSWSTITEMARHDCRVKGHRLSRNFGQHNALLCGIRRAEGEIIITLDDDLQHPPAEIPKLLKLLESGYDVVYGPPISLKHSLSRKLASVATKWMLVEILGAEMARNVCALRVFKSSLRQAFQYYSAPTVNIDVLLSWATSSFAALPVRHFDRKLGRSGYSLSKLYLHALNMITGFSARPIQLVSFLGFLSAMLGLFILTYMIALWLVFGSVVPGFYFLASIISIFSGAIMLSIGVFGEYIARIHARVMEKPQYMIQESSNADI